MCGTFSCDLVVNAKKHRQFLMDIHAFNMSTFVSPKNDPPSTKEVEALRRYQHLWLPLVADTVISNIPLIPPPDIAWLWHCHRLAPQQYNQYCQQTFHRGDNKTIEANPPFTFASPGRQDDDVTETTKAFWQDKYPNESFYLPSDTQDGDVQSLMGGFDLIGSARRQATFLWQVSGEPYTFDSFLENGRDNYEKFMKLTVPAKQLHIILVPTYQIDLMWHTHILSSIEDYNNDCIRLVKNTVHHDDSIDDRKDGGTLDLSYAATEKLWTSVYDTEYSVQDGMYRGEPPSEYFKATWSPEIAGLPKLPKPWVKLHETASDGRDAFIQTSEQKQKDIKKLPHRPHYVLGRCHNKTGYFHIETWEAHFILYYRIKDRLSTVHQEMAADACACGLFANQKKKKARKEEMENLTVVSQKLCGEIFSPKVDGYNTISVASDVLFHCAGGSCGGTIASKSQGTYECLSVTAAFLLP